MPRVRFTATTDHETWEHKDQAVVVDATYGDGTTTKIREDGALRDGDVAEMTRFEAHWCINHYPDNFDILDDAEDEDGLVDPDEHLKDDLIEMAGARGIDVTSDMTKPEIADAINEEDTE
jgi:hypothetical protein